jgi:hypothetical protein
MHSDGQQHQSEIWKVKSTFMQVLGYYPFKILSTNSSELLKMSERPSSQKYAR